MADTGSGGLTRREWLARGGHGAVIAGLLGRVRPLDAQAPAPLASAPGGDVYAALGVRPIINARGTITVLGGSQMSADVRRAMDAATREYVHIDELAEAVGRRLASLAGAEWAIVTSGCSAALTLATAAAVAGADPDKLAQLPDLSRMKQEVIVPASSRSAYDAAVRAVGVRIVEVRTMAELTFALGPRTAMVMVLAGPDADDGPLPLEAMCRAARDHGVPVLVDAAAEELRVPNPHLARGASLVAYSGGKCLRGPQCAGLLLGDAGLTRAAWMHSAPHHGFGRGFKVGREEMIGMLAAVEAWGARDHAREQQQWHAWLALIADRLKDVRGVHTEILQPGPDVLSNRTPTMTIAWDREAIPLSGADVEDALYHGTPRIAVSGAGSFLPFPPNAAPNITIVPYQLREGDAGIVADALHAFFASPPVRPAAQAGGPPAAIAGTWRVTMTFARGSAEHLFVIEQRGTELAGLHVGEFAERELRGQVRAQDVLIWTWYTADGRRLNFEFRGVAVGDEMRGDVSLGEYGRATWIARR